MIVIKGGKKLKGQIEVSGAKNSVQFLIASALLTEETIYLKRVPLIQDVYILNEILIYLNFQVELDTKKNLKICTRNFENNLPDMLLSKLRSSLLFIPGLLHKYKQIQIPFPGGDRIGSRPLDTHFYILHQFGATIRSTSKGYEISRENLHACDIELPFPSFTGTGIAIMMAAKIPQKTILHNVAIEPELLDLIKFLRIMGVEIEQIEKRSLKITGLKKLKGASFTVMPDRLEIGTLLIAAMATKGQITFYKQELLYLDSLCHILKLSGCAFKEIDNKIVVKYINPLIAQDVETGIYPNFPTDLQPQLVALMTQLIGNSTLKENLYDDRFSYVKDLKRMGANIEIVNSNVYIMGGTELKGNEVEATDIRGGAALIIAGLLANGRTIIKGEYHIERGYDNIYEKLRSLGADINKIDK